MTKGHSKITLVSGNSLVDPFGSNAAASQAYKSVERLVAATHMVTNHVPKDEHLRERVRDISGELLIDTIKLRDGFTSLGKGALGSIVAQVRLLLSLLDTLFVSGLISEMNLRVLKEAYIDFINNLDAMSMASTADGVELTKEYFSPETVPVSARRKAAVTTTKIQQDNLNKNEGKKVQTGHRVNKYTSASTQKPNAGTARVSSIIEFITKRGSASTGEVAQVVTGCSTKTLQRDLTALVERGLLVKTGSKRWTKYAIA